MSGDPADDPAEVLRHFSPATASWFRGEFGSATEAQAGAWEAVASGAHTLVVAPTGSGKTLSAFLLAIDRLLTAGVTPDSEQAGPGVRVLYISPLKALAADIERNLRRPLEGIAGQGRGDVRVGIRTGDTPADERRRQRVNPPEILVTTPESLFLLLTSAAAETLRGVDTVIIDEIHALAGTKRGAHLAVGLERLTSAASGEVQRIGLSATVSPHSEAARFLAGDRPVEVVAPSSEKRFDLSVRVPVDDMSELSSLEPEVQTPAGMPGQGSIWPHVEREIVDLVTAHRSTIVFVNSRRLAERLTARLNEIHVEDEHAARADGGGGGGASTHLASLSSRPPAQVMAQSEQSRGAPTELAMAHHGSVSKERRAHIEEGLKTGRLRAVVATSSLELGIDMGDVDLVVQVDAPPTVGNGMQRVGRAGHRVGDTSRAAFFPTHRADLVTSAMTVERMREGKIEQTHVIANPLDVLAQHVVSACAVDEVNVEEFLALVRRSANFEDLPRSAFEATLDMLAGRYPSADFSELRPRIVWDRESGVLRGRPGAQRLAVTSGGTIPDRGNFGVFLLGENRSRVGELDEEMVYESRVGDVFALGASSWRIEQITHDRVLVSPAPGSAGRLPFWIADDMGRPAELGRALGRYIREVGGELGGDVGGAGSGVAGTGISGAPGSSSPGSDDDPGTTRLRDGGLDARAAHNLLDYLREQARATGVLPTDSTLVVESFRDELGDWRVVLHSPFGMGVHAPWAVAVRARVSRRYGIDPSPVAADDGIILRIPDTLDDHGRSVSPGAELFALDPLEVRDLVTTHVGDSALFAARFRECAARALLLPRLDPGKRAPLWQQRLKSSQLLEVARRYPDFPVVLEALRECLRDVYDMAALADLLGEVATGSVRFVEVETATASPFAQSMLFRYVGQFIYEGDSPLAERRAAALSIDSTLLGELLGEVRLRELLDSDVLDEVHDRLQFLVPERAARDAEEVADLLRVLGPLSSDEIRARCVVDPEGPIAELVAEQRIVRLDWAGVSWWVAVEDVARVRDGLGVPVPRDLPAALLERADDPLGELARRFARTRGPFSANDLATRFGLGIAPAGELLDRLAGDGTLVAGEFTPRAVGTEWCDAEVLAQIRRRSLAALRSEIEPVSPGTLARFTDSWHGLAARTPSGQAPVSGPAPTPAPTPASDPDRLLDVIDQLDGVAVPASALDDLVLGARVPGYQPAQLDELLAAGEVVWCGCGRAGTSDGWISLHPADTAPLTVPLRTPRDEGILHRRIRDALAGGAQFFPAIVERLRRAEPTPATGGEPTADDPPPPTDADIRSALWDLVWAGVVTNDTLAPVRAVLAGAGSSHSSRPSPARRGGRRRRMRMTTPVAPRTDPTTGGRWSLAPAAEPDPTLRAHAWAELLLDRHGVVTRGAVESEQVPGGFSAVYKVLATMEDSGRCRRGYFVEGLGAAQFAVGATIDELRRSSDSTDVAQPLVRLLAASDPANPYGAALPWPETSAGGGHRPGRKAGALVVLVEGGPALFVERGGRRVLTFGREGAAEAVRPAADALAHGVRSGVVGGVRGLTVEQIDGEQAVRSPHAAALLDAGFASVPKGLRLRR